MKMMKAIRLYGPRDLRLDEVPCPGTPAEGEVLLRVRAVGICGSDLHTYQHAHIGDTICASPFIVGHEFSGVVEEAGPGAMSGDEQGLRPGVRVAVDPAQPCGVCELCREGHPNLCSHLRFLGLYPCDGSLCEWIRVPARSCFPVPDVIDDEEAALLEPLGVALHGVTLSHIKPAQSAAIIGTGPIGLCILQVLKEAGVDPVFVIERLQWRLKLVERFGARVVSSIDEEAVQGVLDETGGRGVDVAFEAAWSGVSVQHCSEMVRPGGKLIVVGISKDDTLSLQHSTARRKGLTILMVCRMKHTYPHAMNLVLRKAVSLKTMVSHRFQLEEVPEAFTLNAAYGNGVVKVIILI